MSVAWLLEQKFNNSCTGLAAHLEGLVNGTFLVALRAIWLVGIDCLHDSGLRRIRVHCMARTQFGCHHVGGDTWYDCPAHVAAGGHFVLDIDLNTCAVVRGCQLCAEVLAGSDLRFSTASRGLGPRFLGVGGRVCPNLAQANALAYAICLTPILRKLSAPHDYHGTTSRS